MAQLYQCTLHRGQMFSHLGILRMLELLKKCVAWALLSCLVIIIIRKHAFRSNPMLLHVCFRLFSSYSSPPCMLYVYAIYVHVCILTTTYNVIRVSKTYLAVTNNARWSIRSSNWWENAQVRLELCFIRNHIMKSKKIITWNCSFLYKILICFPRNIMSENENEWRWMRKDRY